ncbi:MAG: tRNA (N6-threonylcarbamoyladenosine(37)-N6)-methyltransferase TrmO, partial [Syntrophomonadaceae bacterium]
MEIDTGMVLKPIGVVRSPLLSLDHYPPPGQSAWIDILPDYHEALERIQENSHLWILLWFHKSDRRLLKTVPRRFGPNLPQYGVFGLRSPNRPNPIALTLVRLAAIEGNSLRVIGLDAIDGTPVVDIKSYYEQDTVFSPQTPYIRAEDAERRCNHFYKMALNHHQEACAELLMAVRMAMVADQYMGHLNRPDLRVSVKGSSCLADTIQGLSRARLANPPRFTFTESEEMPVSIWTDR